MKGAGQMSEAKDQLDQHPCIMVNMESKALGAGPERGCKPGDLMSLGTQKVYSHHLPHICNQRLTQDNTPPRAWLLALCPSRTNKIFVCFSNLVYTVLMKHQIIGLLFPRRSTTRNHWIDRCLELSHEIPTQLEPAVHGQIQSARQGDSTAGAPGQH